MRTMIHLQRGIAVAALAVILAAGLLTAAVTNFGAVSLSEYLIATDSIRGPIRSTTPVFAVGDSILHSVSFALDSLGYNAETATGIFTPDRAVTVLRMDVFSHTATASDTCKLYFRSGTALTAKTVYIPTSSKAGSSTTRFTVTAALPCTLFSNDGGVGTGDGAHGKIANITIQYTDN